MCKNRVDPSFFTMALRSHLIKDPHEVLRIIDNMSDSEPESESDDDTAISPELSDVETMESDRDDDDDQPGEPTQGGSGQSQSCHVRRPDDDVDSDDSLPDFSLPARPTGMHCHWA